MAFFSTEASAWTLASRIDSGSEADKRGEVSLDNGQRGVNLRQRGIGQIQGNQVLAHGGLLLAYLRCLLVAKLRLGNGIIEACPEPVEGLRLPVSRQVLIKLHCRPANTPSPGRLGDCVNLVGQQKDVLIRKILQPGGAKVLGVAWRRRRLRAGERGSSLNGNGG